MNRRTLRGWMIAGAALTFALAAWLRLSGLEIRSITHPEMYVPGIHLPAGISEPAERSTLVRVVSSTVASDTHPPVFYVFMLGWTKLFGTGLSAMRLPAAVWGIACIPLVFWLGVLTGNRTAGAIASILLAVNGFHVFYSQIARMYVLACFLGLLSTIILLLAARNDGRSRAVLWLYAVVTLTGLAAHHFFWPLFAAQVLWAVLHVRGGGLSAPVRAQFLLMILASPLIAIAAYQSSAPAAATGGDISTLPWFIGRFLQFGFLYPPGTIESTALSGGLLLFSAFLFAMGVLRPWSGKGRPLFTGREGPGMKIWACAAAVAVLAILGIVIGAKTFVEYRPSETLRLTKALAGLPLIMFGLAVGFEHYSRRAAPKEIGGGGPGGRALIALLALLPLALFAVTALHKPIYNERGALLFTPFLLLGIAAGITAIVRNWWMAAAMALVLIGLHASSLASYRAYSTDKADYRQLAALLKPRVKSGDLIFLRKSWNVTPILYYLPDSRYRLVGHDYQKAGMLHPNARVWALAFYEDEIADTMKDALARYRPVETIEIPRAKAVLYQPQ